MKRHNQVLSYKYARAFLNVFGQVVNRTIYEAIQVAYQALQAERRLMILCAVPTLNMAEKKVLLATIRNQFRLPIEIEKLTSMLLMENRIRLLPGILQAVCREYEKRHGLMRCTIQSSHQIAEGMRQVLETFMQRKTGKIIISEYRINPALIAGIRIQSSSYLWEYSIQRQLNRILQLARN